MALRIHPQAAWTTALAKVKAAVPEAFDARGQVLNLFDGRWQHAGRGRLVTSPLDGTELGLLPALDADTAQRAVLAAAARAGEWAGVDLDRRRTRVMACVGQLREQRQLLAHLLAWEIGKPVAQALVEVDRCADGVAWYVDEIERMGRGRAPLGLVSNVASWNYPLSVLVHAVLVQVLAGNAAIAKVPTEGGLHALTLAFALARREGLPVSLVSGPGAALSAPLVAHPAIAAVAFVGGKPTGRALARTLERSGKRFMLEMEGVNAYGVWDFSDWGALEAQLHKGFAYGKQRCTAYTRFVVQRALMPRFLEMHLRVLGGLRVGHPLAVRDDGEGLPDVDYASLISARQVAELDQKIDQAIARGAVPLYRGELDTDHLVPGQDASAYLAPVALLGVPRSSALHHAEPFGPVDSVVVVDSVPELIAEMNVSNGALVSSIATDDPELARAVGRELRAFKVGHNQTRSRGDRAELFGGVGESWKGCFVGGELLVHALTRGPSGERLHGNFEAYSQLPRAM